ncbi:putative aldose 1-epimerase [Prevotella sp. CAG:1031]|nr:putative aldose 1-epimerase [Prevotella sp. CAG:1031]
MKVSARYRWDDDNSLTLTLEATTDATTVVNLTNHTYFNLDGDGSGTALDHILQLIASRWLPTDDSQVPLGELADVDGTPMDFTSPKPLGSDIHANFEALRIGKGYDHCWAIDGADGTVRPAARLEATRSGRVVEILTDQPALQLYTGNWLTGSPKGKHGDYSDYDAVAIECQDYPDAPNHPSFPSTLLRPGERYHRTIIFRFTTK